MRILKRLLLAVCLLFLLTAGCIFYAFKIEPFRITTNTFAINEGGSGSESVKIIQISDIHIKEDYTYKNLEKVVDRVNRQSPDFVVFTGDLYDNYAKYSDDSHIISALKKLAWGIWKDRHMGKSGLWRRCGEEISGDHGTFRIYITQK